jgi:hypothetical protein
MPPLGVITSYVLYAYSAELQLLARQALNTFAILQVRACKEGCTAPCWRLSAWPVLEASPSALKQPHVFVRRSLHCSGNAKYNTGQCTKPHRPHAAIL